MAGLLVGHLFSPLKGCFPQLLEVKMEKEDRRSESIRERERKEERKGEGERDAAGLAGPETQLPPLIDFSDGGRFSHPQTLHTSKSAQKPTGREAGPPLVSPCQTAPFNPSADSLAPRRDQGLGRMHWQCRGGGLFAVEEPNCTRHFQTPS